MRRVAGRLILSVASRRVVQLSAALAAALAICFPSQAPAADVPGGLEGMVTRVVREDAIGPVAWARYVETTSDVAADLLGKRRGQLSDAVPDRVYLVVLHGDFSMPGSQEGRGPYLAFLYWRARDEWNATDFTLFRRPVPLRSVGVPQAVEPFALVHPTLDRVLLNVWVALWWFLPPVSLAACSVLCMWKRRSRWSYALAACVAVAVVVWQTSLTLRSMAGQSWDPGFHSAKLAVLAVVVTVELAAVYLLLRRRSRLGSAGEAHPGRPPRLDAGSLLMLVAAALYVPSLFWLATTGA
jgi:hypothetical protein